MKSIDLKKYYPHPLHEGENTVILVTDEVANALERFIREENNDTLRRYRAKAYYSLDSESSGTVKSSTGTPSVDAKSFIRSSFGVRTSLSY